MKKVYFLEDYKADLDCKGMGIISLDPAASHSLYMNKIDYKIPEDYYSEKEMLGFGEGYFNEQLNWFRALDKFVKENISYCRKYNIPVFEANYLKIKYVVDTAVIYSYIIDSILKKSPGAEEIVFVHKVLKDPDKPYSPFLFKSKSRELFFNILKMFCEKYKIKFTDILTQKSNASSGAQAGTTGVIGLIAKNKFIKHQAKKLFNFFKYKKFSKVFSTESFLSEKNTLIMHTGSLWMDHPMKELIKTGSGVYLLEEGHIIREDGFNRNKISLPVLEDSFLSSLRSECKMCADKLEASGLMNWINDKCAAGTAALIAPFFRHFISEDCCSILADAERTRRFCGRNNIDYIFVRANTDKDSAGPVISAKYCGAAKSICVQHACFTQNLGTVGIMDTATYDYILTSDKIAHGFYSEFLKERSGYNCSPLYSPHYLRGIPKNCRYRAGNGKREKIVYAVSKFSEGVRCFNGIGYPLTWYYEFQKLLLDIFSKEKDFDFIYKHAPRTGQEWAEKAVIGYIKEKNYDNISIFDEHFLKSLNFADRVIVDCPSATALFETAASGRPVLCIYPDHINNILKSGKSVFGRSLQPFSGFGEIESLVEEFLRAEAKEYTVKLPIAENNFIDTLKEMR